MGRKVEAKSSITGGKQVIIVGRSIWVSEGISGEAGEHNMEL